MKKNTFLCPRCLLRNPYEGTLNPVDDIAFSMPKAFYDKLHSAIAKQEGRIEKKDPNMESLAKLLSQDERFKCITTQEVERYMNVRQRLDNKVAGQLRLTAGWREEKLKWMGIEGYGLSKLSGTVLLDEMCEFYFDKSTDGTLIPERIRNLAQVSLSNERRCAKCGRLLCPDTGKAPEMRILLQGNSRAGKTSCIVSAVRWLQDMTEEFDGRIRIWLHSKDKDQDETHYHNWIHHELDSYNAGYKVVKTPTAQKEPRVFSALISVNGTQTVLTFLDMPGEFFEDTMDDQEELLNQYTLIYKYSDVVWTCMQYEVMALRTLNEAQLQEMEKRTSLSRALLEKVLEKYKSRIREIRNHMEKNGIDPLPSHAVILTKTDAIAGDAQELRDSFIFSTDQKNRADAVVPCPGPRPGERILAMEESEFKRIAASVYRFFDDTQTVRVDSMCRLMQEFSGRICYFAMSAYGHPVVEKKSDGTGAEMARPPMPYHVHLPLLWSMALCDRLPVRYDVTYRERLTGFARLFSQKQFVYRGEGSLTKLFSEADDACRRNLLDNLPDYQYHYVMRSKGGK